MHKAGILLINLGTPDTTKKKSVRRYLREFLSDARVIDLPFLTRLLLVNLFILPFRTKQSAKAYEAIWQAEGSPLRFHSVNLKNALQSKFPKDVQVELAMRYGSPSIHCALERLSNVDDLLIIPLYPQYASASTGSSIEKTLELLKAKHTFPTITVQRDFYSHPMFISAQASQIKKYLSPDDFLLFSYHGLPERQLHKSGCLTICDGPCLASQNATASCYRYQCYQTTALLAAQLGLPVERYTTSFQSRLGKTPWIRPYTDETLQQLIKNGQKNLAVVCPSFVADCLETLEEIGIQAQSQWQQLGGESFKLIPCLNSEVEWVDSLYQIAQEGLGINFFPAE